MLHTFNRILSGLALAGLLFSAACSGASPVVSQGEATPTAIPTPMVASKPTYPVQRGDIVSQLEFSGRVVPAVEEALFFNSDGRVRTIYARSGELVTAGQVLADLISLDDLEKTRKQDELNLRRAEIHLEMARLRQSISATRTPFYALDFNEQMALQAYEVELAQIALEEQQLKSSKVETSIQDAQIIAPIGGRLLTSRLQAGEPVKAFDIVAIVGDDTQLEIGAKLISTQMELLSEGMDCIVEFANRPGEGMPGVIRQMPYPYGSASQNSENNSGASGARSTSDTNTRITVSLPAGTTLKVSDMLSVRVVLESKSGVLWLPPSAIRAFEGRNFVVVQTDTAPRRVDIKTGLRNDDRVQILEGLEEGQVVIAP